MTVATQDERLDFHPKHHVVKKHAVIVSGDTALVRLLGWFIPGFFEQIEVTTRLGRFKNAFLLWMVPRPPEPHWSRVIGLYG